MNRWWLRWFMIERGSNSETPRRLLLRTSRDRIYNRRMDQAIVAISSNLQCHFEQDNFLPPSYNDLHRLSHTRRSKTNLWIYLGVSERTRTTWTGWRRLPCRTSISSVPRWNLPEIKSFNVIDSSRVFALVTLHFR